MISKEAREAAQAEVKRHLWRLNAEMDVPLPGEAVQSLLDAQKSESEKKLAEVREFAANAAIDLTKAEATIMRLAYTRTPPLHLK